MLLGASTEPGRSITLNVPAPALVLARRLPGAPVAPRLGQGDNIFDQRLRFFDRDRRQFRALGVAGIAAAPLIHLVSDGMNAMHDDLLAHGEEFDLLIGVTVRRGQRRPVSS